MQDRDPRLIMAELAERVEQLEVDVTWLTAEFKYWRELHERAEPGRQSP